MLLAFALGVLLAVGGCGEAGEREVPLYVLAGEGSAHDGERVVTQGVVRRFDDPLHYWIEDRDLNRVELFPHEAVENYLGQSLRVTGTFRLAERGSRRLTVTHLETLGE